MTELSGRGIGMDVVKRNIETLRGTIELDTEAGKGTTISLRLPLTLSIVEGFSVRVGEETYVLPLGSVIECVELPEAERRPGRMGVLNLRGHALPYLRLREHFGVEGRVALILDVPSLLQKALQPTSSENCAPRPRRWPTTGCRALPMSRT